MADSVIITYIKAVGTTV